MGWGWGWKILILYRFTENPVYRGDGEGGGHEKLIYKRELPNKGGLGQFAQDLVFLRGVDTPMHTMNLAITLTVILIYWCQC